MNTGRFITVLYHRGDTLLHEIACTRSWKDERVIRYQRWLWSIESLPLTEFTPHRLYGARQLHVSPQDSARGNFMHVLTIHAQPLKQRV